jgi:FkbM family methyltransferase
MLDIGANYGTHTLYIANLIKKNNNGGKVYTFEIQPKILDLLQENINLNNLNEYIDINNFGLGNTDGEMDLIIPNDYNSHENPGGISLNNNDLNEKNHKIKVPIKRLDELSLSNISIIKIDVEGFELEVFEGGKQTIIDNKPIIIIEIWDVNKDKYFKWINENFPFYNIEKISRWDYRLVPK